jgi:hypothetical protein
MNRNFSTKQNARTFQEALVASVWTILLVVMFAASLLDGQSKPVETANITAAPAGSAQH